MPTLSPPEVATWFSFLESYLYSPGENWLSEFVVILHSDKVNLYIGIQKMEAAPVAQPT